MTDIVERLRWDRTPNSASHEAAAEIERLRELLREIEALSGKAGPPTPSEVLRGMETLATMDGFHNGPEK